MGSEDPTASLSPPAGSPRGGHEPDDPIEVTTPWVVGLAVEPAGVERTVVVGDGSARSPAGAHSAPAAGSGLPLDRLGVLARGGMGEVHVARHRVLRRKEALKTLLAPSPARSPELASRFLAEAQITAQLEHPNIVPIYSIALDDGELAYTMRLVPGRTLAELIDDTRSAVERGATLSGEVTLPARLEVFLRICDALGYAHERGVIHRDLKPANVMIGRHGEVYVMDWGIARVIGAVDDPLDRLDLEAELPDGSSAARLETQLGVAVGTLRYMSPEQAEGRNSELDGRSDIFALGLILQELATLAPARRPHPDQAGALAQAQQGDREPPPSEVLPQRFRRELEAIVAKACAPARERRYQRVADLAEDLRRLLRQDETSVLPDGPWRRLARWAARHQSAALALGVAFVATFLAIAVDARRLEAVRQDARELERFGLETAALGRHLERELGEWSGLLEYLDGAATELLAHGQFADDDLLDGGSLDPLANAERLIAEVVEETDLGLTSSLGRLRGIDTALRRVVAGAISESSTGLDDTVRAAIRSGTSPIDRAFVSLHAGAEGGALIGWPARGAPLPPPEDARRAPVGHAHGRWWRGPVTAPGGEHMVLVTALHDGRSERGLVGIEVRVETLRQLLGEGEVVLLATDGVIVAATSSHAIEAVGPEPGHRAELAAALAAVGVDRRDGRLRAAVPITGTSWTMIALEPR